MAATNEHAFEAYVVENLLANGGWCAGELSQWNKALSLFPQQIIDFIADTQPKLWAEAQSLNSQELENMFVANIVKELDSKGSLHVIRHGIKFHGKTFRLAYFKPANDANYEILEQVAKNRWTVTRQVPCHRNDNNTLDIVLALNGLPVATIELKNPNTSQNWKHAVRQYMTDRDPREPMFDFKKRALVHFAADPDEVHMTTRLAGDKTFFLPFNRGSNPGQIICGAGNPQHTSGYRTGYFWEEVLHTSSFLEILGKYIFLEKKDEKVDDGKGGYRIISKETMVFPRYHQLDAVRKLTQTAKTEGSGKNYLIQHSAGSGKTNSISWLSHQLASLHNAKDEKVFDCVVVITDRQVLDRQLQDAIYQIEHAQGVVKAIDQDSRQLASALIDGTKIVITTLQKFPFVLNGLLHFTGAETRENATPAQKDEAAKWEAEIAKRRYAVIVDEAHSSQSGETSRELKAILGGAAKIEDREGLDWEDGLNEVMQSRGKQDNISFFAFTATPKGKTMELFGRIGQSGMPDAFHLYSMRQAIEEGFILDVLQNYTTYSTYFRIVKSIEDDPEVPKKKAARAVSRYLSLHPYNIEQKIAIIIEHFRDKVRAQLSGMAKAMVVTQSRLHAVRYKLAFDRYIAEHKITDVRPLVAFSGTVRDPDTEAEYTEPSMNVDVVTGNSIGEKQLPGRFASPDYQVLLVANKYQTGFDQPLLCAMYVDKRLDGVQAVQTLSRLNRMIRGKQSPFVLDFVNQAEDIYLAFKPYFDGTSLEGRSDPHQLEQLRHELDSTQVYLQSEVESFARVFYKQVADQRPKDHSLMEKAIQPAVDRFKALAEETKRSEFREKLSGYVKLYAFMSQIMPYWDEDLEKLYSFGRLLVPHLPLENETERVTIGNEVGLEYYRLERIFTGAIDMRVGEPEAVKSPTDVGTGKAKDIKVPLSEIITVLNDRFGTNFTDEDRYFFEQIREKAVNDEDVIKMRRANPLDNFQKGLRKLLEDLIMQRMDENDSIVTKYMEDKAFGDVAFEVLSKAIYEGIPYAA